MRHAGRLAEAGAGLHGDFIADAFEALTPFGEAATPLKSLANYLVERKH